ncbi:MAG TPA: glycosyl hydrolase family 18 protein, partial [Actinomycetales bacterium]|nr:glycosyl hydrolase family 18 protein [Actinomycetales bacterium]
MKLTFRRGMASVATAALTLGVAVTATPAFADNGDSDEFVMYVTNWGEMDTVKRLHDSQVANYVTTINYAFGDVAPRDLTREEASGHPDIPGSGTGLVDWEDYDEAEHGPIICKPTDPEIDFFREFSADESVSGRAETGGLVNQLALLKQMHPQIKVVPSLGGATLSKWFSLASLTEESRATLIDSCVDLWINGNYADDENGAAENFAGVFDGVDIDWEFPAFVDPDTGEPEDRSGNDLSIDANDAENYSLLA